MRIDFKLLALAFAMGVAFWLLAHIKPAHAGQEAMLSSKLDCKQALDSVVYGQQLRATIALIARGVPADSIMMQYLGALDKELSFIIRQGQESVVLKCKLT